MRISDSDSRFLTQLIIDCETYNLKERESLEYIEKRFGTHISRRTYYYYKNNVKNEEGLRIQTWVENHTRVGYLVYFKKMIDSLEKSFNDTSIQLLIEIQKPYEERDENKILKLNAEQRESAKILTEFTLNTPIIMKIKEKMDEKEKKNDELRSQIRELERKQKDSDLSIDL
jgi:hypothetical protein